MRTVTGVRAALMILVLGLVGCASTVTGNPTHTGPADDDAFVDTLARQVH